MKVGGTFRLQIYIKKRPKIFLSLNALYPKIMNRKHGILTPALLVMCFIIRSRNKKVPERRSFRHCVNSVTVIALLYIETYIYIIS